jgi:hypothetical protein
MGKRLPYAHVVERRSIGDEADVPDSEPGRAFEHRLRRGNRGVRPGADKSKQI